MASYTTNQLRAGVKVMLEGDPCVILENELVKPGKGQAFSRVRLRNLKTDRVWERTFKSGESLEQADVIESETTYSYTDGEFYYFIINDGSYEQIQVDRRALGSAINWLKPNDELYTITLHNDVAISVTPPNFVLLEVVQTEPALRKGDTATGGSKPATLSTGVDVRVPHFIMPEELVRIDTRTGEYAGRAK